MSDVTKTFVKDSRISTGAEVFKIPQGARQVQYMSIPFDNQPAEGYGSSIQIASLNIPNADTTCISRLMKVAYKVVITVPTATCVFPTALNQDQNPNTILRQFPLHSVTEVLNVGLNSSITSTQPRYFLGMLSRFMNTDLEKISQCPAMPDYGVNLPIAGAQNVQNSPFNMYAQAMKNGLLPRGAHLASVVENSPIGFDVATFYVQEPVLCSPLSLNDEQEFLYNVEQLSLNYTVAKPEDMVLSQVDVAPVVKIYGARLEIAYLTVDPSFAKIPVQVNYDYTNYQPNPFRNTTAVTSNLDITITSQTLSFNSLPSRIFAGVRKQLTSRGPSLKTGGNASCNDDIYLSLLSSDGDSTKLNRASVNIGTKNTSFSNMSVAQWYEMARRNGYNSSYYDYTLGSGSILCFSPTLDIGIDPSVDTVVGENGKINFSMQITVSAINLVKSGIAGGDLTNMLADLTNNYELFIIPEYAGVCSITHKGPAQYLLGDVTPADVKSASTVEAVPEASLPPHMQGSGLFNGKFGHLVKKGIGKIASLAASEEGQKVMGQLAGKAVDRLARL